MPKIRFFRLTGVTRCTDSGQTWQADGHLDPLGCTKFHLNRRKGWECGPQNIKNFNFLVKNLLAEVNPLIDFKKF